jgi:hypothetical protein
MKIRIFMAMLGAVTMMGVAPMQSNAQGTKLGELSDLHAWVDKMPPGPASIHATGKITAPTPCYDALAEFAGLDKSNPPIYLVKVTLRQRPGPGACIQVVSNIAFSYSQPNYTDNAEKMTIFSDQDSKTIPIEIVH